MQGLELGHAGMAAGLSSSWYAIGAGCLTMKEEQLG